MNQQTVHFCIFDTLSDWEAGYAIAGINNPQFQKIPGRYRVQTVAMQKSPIKSIGGLSINPDILFDELSPDDSAMLILPGGTGWDEGKNEEIIKIAGKFLDSGRPIAAICGATAGLARGGLLDTRKHTSNALEYLAATNYTGADLYETEPAVSDDNVITASGTAPVDFAYHIFKCLDLYTPAALEAWYGLYKTGKPEFFGALMAATAS